MVDRQRDDKMKSPRTCCLKQALHDPSISPTGKERWRTCDHGFECLHDAGSFSMRDWPRAETAVAATDGYQMQQHGKYIDVGPKKKPWSSSIVDGGRMSLDPFSLLDLKGEHRVQ